MRLTAERTAFPGAIALNGDNTGPRKAILICGTARGGTSFAASAFANLGVPFSRSGGREVSRRTLEHRELRDAFQAGDAEAIKRIAGEFAAEHEVWAWKLPALHRGFELIGAAIDDPHFVFVFKEPVSIAFRRQDLKGADVLTALEGVVSDYGRLVEFAGRSEAPILLVSYETAMASLEDFVPAAAEFAGVTAYDAAAVAEGIRGDGERYYVSPKKRHRLA